MTDDNASREELLEELQRVRTRVSDLETRDRLVARATNDAIWDWDLERDTVAWNDAVETLFGYRRDQVGPDAAWWSDRIHPDDRARVLGGIHEIIGRGRAWRAEYRYRRADASYALVIDRGYVQRDAAGKATRMIGSMMDISDRRRMEEDLLRARKLEAIGVLAGGIAHDFNNLLAVLLGNTLLLKGEIGDDRAAARLSDCEEACLRARRLTQQLLTFAAGGAPVKSAIPAADALRDACRAVTGHDGVRIDLALPQDLWPIEGDAGQLAHLFESLIRNACEAMPDGGVVRISGANRGDGPERFVDLTIADEGPGIAEQNLPRIFDPYFTTKERASGLGLATAHSIATRHGGTIRVVVAGGRGAIFQVALPAARPAAAYPEETLLGAGDGVSGLAGARILVMDDEPMVRQLMGEMLRAFGCEPTLAPDGDAALGLFETERRAGRPFAAVILDLTVPGGMGGRETLVRLRAIDPHVRAIVASGYSNDPVMAEFAQHGFKGVVAKPFRPDDLGRTLRAVLERGS